MRALLVAGFLSALTAGLLPANADPPKVDSMIARGRYLVVIGACNDCHTQGWRSSDGRIPLRSWMTGNRIGLRYAWGTEYPVNVRAWFHDISEADWLFSVRTRAATHMQWHDLRHLTLTDQRAIYRFVRSLGNSGATVPNDVGPGREPRTPYIDLRLRTPDPNAPD